jgi:4-amino-4-deoxy-L-arabinose transferase-like glycosyltransferase
MNRPDLDVPLTNREVAGVALLMLALLALNAASILHKTATADELDHLHYGARVLGGDTTRIHDSKMPVTAFNALLFGEPSPMGQPAALYRARLVTTLFSLLLGLLVWRWARSLYGPAAGLLTLGLWTFCPSVIAHSRLVTTDLYGALGFAATCYATWRYLRRPGWIRALAVGAALGFALVAKCTAVYLLPALALVAVLQWRRLPGARPLVAQLCLVTLATLLVVNSAFLFRGTFTPLQRYECRSALFQALQDGPIAALPIPLPRPWVEGVDWVRFRDRNGMWGEDVVVLGRHSEFQGLPHTYLVVLLTKFPLAWLALLAAGLGVVARTGRRGWLHGDEAMLLIPALVLITALSLLTRAQLGVRHLLVVVPLLCVVAGATVRGWHALPRWRKAVVGGLAAWLLISTLSYHPHYIPYFNELVWDRTKAYRVLLDSNLDWGQDGWYVQQYLQDHPGVETDARFPFDGTYLVSANQVGGLADTKHYVWLQRHDPVDHVGYSHLVYEISGYTNAEAGAEDP